MAYCAAHSKWVNHSVRKKFIITLFFILIALNKIANECITNWFCVFPLQINPIALLIKFQSRVTKNMASIGQRRSIFLFKRTLPDKLEASITFYTQKYITISWFWTDFWSQTNSKAFIQCYSEFHAPREAIFMQAAAKNNSDKCVYLKVIVIFGSWLMIFCLSCKRPEARALM